jgi:hypothetical protein
MARLEDRRRDARLVMMYKISHGKVAVSKSDSLSPPLTQEAKSLIGFTTDLFDVAFPFEVIADCYSQIFCLISRFQDMIVKAIFEFYRRFIM